MIVDKLLPLIERYDNINKELVKPEILSDVKLLSKLTKEQSDLSSLVERAKEYLGVLKSIEDSRELLDDKELGDLVKEEIKILESKKIELEEEIKILLIPKDPNSNKNVYLEIRAGTGGDEAGIFVGDLFKAYCRYAESKKWKVEIISSSENNVGGYKEVIALIKGDGVYSRSKYEGGTHRVQRVPDTESSGRIHTSTATVAVLPEVDDVEIEINPTDLKVDTFRSSGAGGQHINKTESAIRITHIPTGVVVECQTERSQIQNRETAMKMLRSKLYEAELERKNSELASARKSQVGSGDRSEKIRTYNFPQGRITDHRIGLSIFQIDEFLNGGLDEMIDALNAADRAAKLAEEN